MTVLALLNIVLHAFLAAAPTLSFPAYLCSLASLAYIAYLDNISFFFQKFPASKRPDKRMDQAFCPPRHLDPRRKAGKGNGQHLPLRLHLIPRRI